MEAILGYVKTLSQTNTPKYVYTPGTQRVRQEGCYKLQEILSQKQSKFKTRRQEANDLEFWSRIALIACV